MMLERLVTLCLSVSAALVLWAAPVLAAPELRADEFVDRFGTRAVEALSSTAGDPAARRARFEELLQEGLDMPKIAALVLGRAWRGADPDQRARFVEVFEDHLIVTYARRLDTYAGQRLEVGAETPAGDDMLVASKVTPRDGEPVEVVWRLRAKDDQWRIIDASVAGVSMVVTWRNEFAAVIERDGLDGLIQRLASAAEFEQTSMN
ncbi:MAG TPA: ABC transporter substrate-binding protein [Geminicoccus sp.]|jgi:phospholipid transport system substrate-binding protein|uniref:MlaC/ttg2D family ABC transporter substrate-binding protein n=1 Tax=Geminicoccus sp. TaxID=2024832 RepID=UPI002E323CD6|nr:ABC transporter substrate-binding protein [Geminicoccus sp.]HEX2529049.1 ABC transporter substrate-binding protein [Geminicoccus sp.]